MTLVSILLIIFFISTIKPFGRCSSDILSENRIARNSIFALLILSAGFGFMGSLNLNRLRSKKISNHRISQVTLETERKSVYVNYARPVTGRIVEKQNIFVDAITGATTTSKCIMKAAENVLKKAG